MIRRQTVQWVLLPAGLTPDGMLAASVFVAPRLRPGGAATLADFPDFADWPATVAGLEFEIVRADGAREAPLSVTHAATSERWSALFPPATTVRPFHFDDFADRPMVSYPVREVLGHLRNRWADLAHRALDDLPITTRHASPIGGAPVEPDQDRPTTLADHFAELRAVGQRGIFEGVADVDELSSRIRSALDDSARRARELREAHHPTVQPLLQPFGSGGTPADAMYALAGFHARPATEVPKAFPATREQLRDELAEHHDFHHQLSVLGDHPALLRAVGLVFDLQLRPDFVPTTGEGDPPVPLRVAVRRDSAFPARSDDPDAEVWNVDVTPATWCRLTMVGGQAFFSAAERSGRGDFAHGFLHLDPARYAAAAVDVDGLALKALGLAATLTHQDEHEQRPIEEPARDGVPSPRTGGIAVLHTGRADELHDDLYAARAADDALEADPDAPADLAAEELVRGYRLDVLPEGTGGGADGQWRSLHARQVSYRFLRDPAQSLELTDEGHVQLGLTAEADRPDAPADPDRPVYLHETLTTWDGWSLAAPRPGHAIPQEPAVPEPGGDLTSMQLEVATAPSPGTLPRLRFGAAYRLRIRTVDLAGNAHTPKVADNLASTLEGSGDPRYTVALPAEPLVYRRFEPVPPPELVPRWLFGPGEGLERLVIRSAPGMSADEYAAASATAEDETLRFHATSERHVAASKAALQLVETHGLLDEAFDAVRGLDPGAAAAAVQEWYAVAARENGSFRDTPGARFVATGVHDGTEQGYVCLDADTVDLPYLPDPLGVGTKIRLRPAPGEAEQTLELRYADGGGWYRPRPLRLRLAEGEPGLDHDAAAGLLTVRVPAGRSATLRLSSLFDHDPELFGIVDWCRQELSPERADAVVEAVKAGTHWMTAPWRDLVLVHAVQRPLVEPLLELETDTVAGFAGEAVLARDRGATTADLRGVLSADLPSTAQLDVEASWEEHADDPGRRYADAEEFTSVTGGHVFSVPVPEPFGTPWQPEAAPLIEPLEDRAVAFRTRGREAETPEERRVQLRQQAAAAGLTAPERRRLEAAAAQLEQLRGHEFGDTKYRRVSYTPVASTRFREYFDPALPPSETIATGPPATVHVLSSAPPAKPIVLQVLPLLEYEQERTGDVTVSRRQGRGLRVWLARPWCSAGIGELLAVVCSRGGPLTESSELSREITVISGDPAHRSPRCRSRWWPGRSGEPTWCSGTSNWPAGVRPGTSPASSRGGTRGGNRRTSTSTSTPARRTSRSSASASPATSDTRSPDASSLLSCRPLSSRRCRTAR